MTAISAIPLDVAEPIAQTPKKRRASIKSELKAMSKAMVEEEGLLNHSQAGFVLDISARRVAELVELGTFTRFDFLGRTYVSLREVVGVPMRGGNPGNAPARENERGSGGRQPVRCCNGKGALRQISARQ